MSDDVERASPKHALARHGLHAKRSFGQNFLADTALCRRIAELAAPEAEGTVLEIGAGLGALTRPLLTRAWVVAIERDRDLVPALAADLADAVAAGRLRVVEADAKTLDFAGALGDLPRPHTVAGNLPYQITGPLLERLTAEGPWLRRATVLVQLEVADRMTARPGDDAWGGLSVFLQARFQCHRAFVVRRGAFHPQPRVDSAVVTLDGRRDPTPETPTLRALVHGAFQKRRKTLRNAWEGIAEPDALRAAAAAAGVTLEVRGETLSVEQFAEAASFLDGPRGVSP